MREMSCGFGFDLRYNDQHSAVLDYRLLGENSVISMAQKVLVDQGHKFYFEGIAYQFERPTSLYVKWKNDQTGSTFEDTVDLRQVLPRNLEDTNLYFIVHGAQLFVYLALKEKYVQGSPRVGGDYAARTNIQLYPKVN